MLRPNKQQRWSWAIALGLGLGSTVVPGALAVRLRDGKVHFVQPPSLVSATTTRNEASAWSATYYFTVAVPENADEPLGQLMLEQREGVDTLRYRLGETFAYEGGDRQQPQPRHHLVEQGVQLVAGRLAVGRAQQLGGRAGHGARKGRREVDQAVREQDLALPAGGLAHVGVGEDRAADDHRAATHAAGTLDRIQPPTKGPPELPDPNHERTGASDALSPMVT